MRAADGEGIWTHPAVAVELADVNYGAWRGKEIDEIQVSYPEGLATWLTDGDATPHGGESFVELIARVERWTENQAKRRPYSCGDPPRIDSHGDSLQPAGSSPIVLAY
jgi:broad specificity phosphatase PhoE